MPVDTSRMLPGIGKRIREEEDLRALKHQQALENLRTELAIKQDEARQRTASQLSATEKELQFKLDQQKIEADRAREFQDKQYVGDMVQQARAADMIGELNPVTGQPYTTNEAFAKAGMNVQKARLPNLYGQMDIAERAGIGLETSKTRGRLEADNAIKELQSQKQELQKQAAEAELAKLLATGKLPTAEAIERTKSNAELERQQGLSATAGARGIEEGRASLGQKKFLAENPEVGVTGMLPALARILGEQQATETKKPLTDAQIKNLEETTRKKKLENDILEEAAGSDVLGFGKKSQPTTGATPKYNPMLYGTNVPTAPRPNVDMTNVGAATPAPTTLGPQNKEYGPTGPVTINYSTPTPVGVLDPATRNILLQNILFNAGRKRNINSNLFEQ